MKKKKNKVVVSKDNLKLPEETTNSKMIQDGGIEFFIPETEHSEVFLFNDHLNEGLTNGIAALRIPND